MSVCKLVALQYVIQVLNYFNRLIKGLILDQGAIQGIYLSINEKFSGIVRVNFAVLLRVFVLELSFLRPSFLPNKQILNIV